MTLRRGRSLIAASLLTVLAGCAELAPVLTAPGWDIERVAQTPAPSDPMAAELRDGYLRLATVERDRRDWRDTAAFLAKAKAAAEGETPPPFTLADRTIGSDALRIPLEAAEPQLLALLGAPGARLRAPGEIARAQLDWECWLEEAEEGHQFERIDACATAFEQSLAAARAAARLPAQLVVVLPEEGGAIGGVVLTTADGGEIVLDSAFAAGSTAGGVAVAEEEVREIFAGALDARPAPPRFFTIYFDFNSRALDAEAAAIVMEVVEDAAGRASAEIVLQGHADAVGEAEANLSLSRGRALQVRDAIAAAIGPDRPARISTSFRGAADLAEPTRGAERLNRRVEITVR